MAEGELTRGEKVILLGIVDGKRMDDFNKEFLNLMVETPPLKIEEVNDRIRRSIFKFLGIMETDEEISLLLSDADAISLVQAKIIVAWLHGYAVARRWNRSLTLPSTKVQGFSGLVQGFPDGSARAGEDSGQR